MGASGTGHCFRGGSHHCGHHIAVVGVQRIRATHTPNGPSEAQQFLDAMGGVGRHLRPPQRGYWALARVSATAPRFQVRRRELSAHVRVDLLPTLLVGHRDIVMPDAYYASGANTLVFGDKSHGPRVGISAWFRNLQAHPQESPTASRRVSWCGLSTRTPPLGTAGGEYDSHPIPLRGKPVRVQVAPFPASWEARVIVCHIRYADMYGGRKLSLPVQTKGPWTACMRVRRAAI